jgi:hypothetical protein
MSNQMIERPYNSKQLLVISFRDFYRDSVVYLLGMENRPHHLTVRLRVYWDLYKQYSVRVRDYIDPSIDRMIARQLTNTQRL